MENEQEVSSVMSGKKGKKSEADSQAITLTVADLKELISQSQADNARIIAEALIQSRIPYKDPKQQQNEETMRQSMRETQERIKREIEAGREACPHKQGSNPLSEFQGQLSSFVFHRLDTGETIGLCTNCLKEIRSTNPGDLKFFKEKSANRMSSSGVRTFMDPRKAMLAGRPDGGRNIIEKEAV